MKRSFLDNRTSKAVRRLKSTKLTIPQKRTYDQLVSSGGVIANHWNHGAYMKDRDGNHICWIRQSVLHNLIYKKKIYMDKDSDVHHRIYKPIL